MTISSTSAPLHRLLLIAVLFLTSSASAILPDDSNATVYEMLPKFGLPSGLLPSSVTSYSYTPSDGRFEVQLSKPCYIQFDYLVYYDRRITGKLKYGSISDLKGIQVQKFFLWLSVDEIKVDLPPSNSIYFQVGIVNKKLDVSQFQTVRDCKNKALVGCDGSWEPLIKVFEKKSVKDDSEGTNSLNGAPVAFPEEVDMLLTE